MKLFKFTSILAITLLLLTSCKDKETSQNVSTNETISKIEVIDFHSTHRCMTCNAIEANTKFTLDTYFSKDVNDGKITFQVINVDEKENEKLAEKFQASGTALFLNVIKDGKERHIDLTEFAFMEGNDQDVFSKELKSKIENELKTL
jgi:hypothetical protein